MNANVYAQKMIVKYTTLNKFAAIDELVKAESLIRQRELFKGNKMARELNYYRSASGVVIRKYGNELYKIMRGDVC